MELWNWYINLFSNEDDKIKLAAWAATITTLGFLITFVFKPLYTILKRRFEKLHLELGFAHRIIPGEKVHFMPPILYCRVINRSPKPVYIRKPFLTFSKPIGNRKKFTAMTMSGSFPIKLDPGQQYEDEYNILELEQQVFGNNNLKGINVKFAVTSTSGKTYFSKSKPANIIQEQLQLAARQNVRE